MTLKNYTYIWFFISLFVIFEYFALNFHVQWSLLNFAKLHLPTSPFFKSLNLSPLPGRQISLYLGWAGFSLMLAMNVYTLKKRIKFFSPLLPSLAATFNFHIFCGLLGPTFILFHSNFKVHGLVAISFWSMIVSATSGVLGRYLYGQLMQKKLDLKNAAASDKAFLESEFNRLMPKISPERREQIMQDALVYVGLPAKKLEDYESLGVWQVLAGSIAGDSRLYWAEPNARENLHLKIRALLTKWALTTRRNLYLDPLQRLMGYWHAFHLPFAFFMYSAAFIHILAALLLGVKR